MPDDMLRRNVNVGFSGGEKKRNEVLQMAILRPRLAILDETDSGLDIDALRIVADGVNALRGPDFSALVITHYQRLLDHRAGPGARAGRRADRALRRPGAGARAGGERLRRVGGGGGMSAVDPVGAAGFLARYEGLKNRLPGDPARARGGGRGVSPQRAARPARRGLEIHQPARR